MAAGGGGGGGGGAGAVAKATDDTMSVQSARCQKRKHM